jgi:hypothetical protein
MSWRVAKSLITLRSQVDAAHPGRAKFNDGTIGDTAHQARVSDHNPNRAGVVQALDLSHDPAHGFDSYAFADMLRQKKDGRLKYVISNSRIFSTTVNAWEWRPYSGADAHQHHVHISVSDDPARYDDDRAWDIDAATATVAAPPPSPPAPPPPAVAPPLHTHDEVVPADATPPVTDAMRHTMAKHILDFEARRDRAGNLMVYQLPADDGGGSYEVAGINEKFDGPMAAKLKAMVEAGQYAAAETEAENYILGNTNPAMAWTTNAAVEFYLRDCVFNRGAHGAARILQHACGVSSAWRDKEDDGDVGDETKKAIEPIAPADLLTRLRAAREDYEREIVGYRANMWNGLVNRWNSSLTIARYYLA